MIYTLPVIAALIGWITNYIAIKMLFRPRKPVKIIFFTIQGIFPKRQKSLAEKLGKIVSQELLSSADIKKALMEQADNPEVNQHIEQHLDKFLKTKLKETMPMLAMFMSDDIINKIKHTLMEEIQLLMPELVQKYAAGIQKQFDVEKIVFEKVVNFSIDKLEEILYSIMQKEFKFIELIGAVLGFIIGIIQVFLLKLA